MQKTRCHWASNDPLYIEYHDHEWGVPVYDEQKLFEFILLEGAQAGLSWITILKRRENYRQAFDQFDPYKIARYNEKKLSSLLNDPGIIRNRLKVQAAVLNAQAFLQVKQELGNFTDYLWQFVDGKPIINHWSSASDVPVSTSVSDAMAKDLKKRGFKFVGTTICYAFMQAVGMVNDHTTNCFLSSHI
ncbi:MAG: DNA-3-methyladenine glycosylase I [Gammaproteobacteria bacterium]